MREEYFQIMLDEESRDLTTFSDGVTLYRFRRLPFGLNCSPAIFSRRMASMLTSLLQKGWVRNYLDDLILWAPNFPELLTILKQLFSLLTDNGVKLNLSKCTLGLKEVTFLGHRISAAGSKPDRKNIDAVARMKAKTNVKEVRRFKGMCRFYRKHVPSFAKVAAPLTNLTRTEESQQAFEQLKSMPRGIVLDNGVEFTSREFQQFCHKHHITLYYTTPSASTAQKFLTPDALCQLP